MNYNLNNKLEIKRDNQQYFNIVYLHFVEPE